MGRYAPLYVYTTEDDQREESVADTEEDRQRADHASDSPYLPGMTYNEAAFWAGPPEKKVIFFPMHALHETKHLTQNGGWNLSDEVPPYQKLTVDHDGEADLATFHRLTGEIDTTFPNIPNKYARRQKRMELLEKLVQERYGIDVAPPNEMPTWTRAARRWLSSSPKKYAAKILRGVLQFRGAKISYPVMSFLAHWADGTGPDENHVPLFVFWPRLQDGEALPDVLGTEEPPKGRQWNHQKAVLVTGASARDQFDYEVVGE